MDNPIDTQKKYQEYVDKKSPNSPIFKNCINSFLFRWFNLFNWSNYFFILYF